LLTQIKTIYADNKDKITINTAGKKGNSTPEIDINKLLLHCKDTLPEEFDLFFDTYYKKYPANKKPKTISALGLEELINLNEKVLLEQMGYTEDIPEIESTSLKCEDTTTINT
jgi:hypothetical protein